MVFMQWRKQICLKIEMVGSEIECVPHPLSYDQVGLIQHHHSLQLLSTITFVTMPKIPQVITDGFAAQLLENPHFPQSSNLFSETF